MKTKIFFAIFFIFQLCASARLLFDINTISDGEIIELPKPKRGVKDIGEDSFSTSPFCLVVADGVGSSEFSSKYISNFLVDEFQMSVLQKLKAGTLNFESEADIIKYTHEIILIGIKMYTEMQNEFVREWQVNESKLIDVQQEVLATSTTFIAAVISESNEHTGILEIIQKGDSQAIIFRKTESRLSKGRFYYAPIYFTKNQEHEFNTPFQFDTLNTKTDIKELISQRFQIQKHDLVILGSDGFFDNVHPGILSMIVNSLLVFPDIDIDFLFLKLNRFFEIYAEILKNKYWVITENFKNKNRYSLENENNEVRPTGSIPGKIVYSFFKNIFETGNDRLSEKTQNKFKLFLDKQIGELLRTQDNNLDQVSAFEEFFTCPILKMLSIPNNFGNNINILSDCVKDAIERKMTADENEFSKFVGNYSPVNQAQILAKSALFFSSKQFKFPSTFSINAWKDSLTTVEGSGKPDDVTVVATIVKLRDDSVDVASHMKTAVFKQSEKKFKEMKLDLNSFLTFFNSKKAFLEFDDEKLASYLFKKFSDPDLEKDLLESILKANFPGESINQKSDTHHEFQVETNGDVIWKESHFVENKSGIKHSSILAQTPRKIIFENEELKIGTKENESNLKHNLTMRKKWAKEVNRINTELEILRNEELKMQGQENLDGLNIDNVTLEKNKSENYNGENDVLKGTPIKI